MIGKIPDNDDALFSDILSYDLSELSEMADGDLGYYNGMLNQLIDKLNFAEKNFPNFIETQNWSSIADCMHKLIPSLGFVGMKDLIPLIVEFETKILEGKQLEIKWQIEKCLPMLSKISKLISQEIVAV